MRELNVITVPGNTFIYEFYGCTLGEKTLYGSTVLQLGYVPTDITLLEDDSNIFSLTTVVPLEVMETFLLEMDTVTKLLLG